MCPLTLFLRHGRLASLPKLQAKQVSAPISEFTGNLLLPLRLSNFALTNFHILWTPQLLHPPSLIPSPFCIPIASPSNSGLPTFSPFSPSPLTTGMTKNLPSEITHPSTIHHDKPQSDNLLVPISGDTIRGVTVSPHLHDTTVLHLHSHSPPIPMRCASLRLRDLGCSASGREPNCKVLGPSSRK